MISFNASYYIDEIHNWLKWLVDPVSFEAFYKNEIRCQLENGPHSILQDEVPPLLKVAWNILHRGEPTRASLRLSAYLLQKNFKGSGDPANSKSEVAFGLGNFWGWDSSIILSTVQNLHRLTPAKVSEFGSHSFGIYNYLKDCIRFAQLQKTMLLAMMADPSPVSFSIEGISEAEGRLLQDDLNDLFSALNNLTAVDEPKIPLLLQEGANAIRISLEEGDASCMRLRPVGKDQPDPLNFCVLTDRRIQYVELGVVVKSEVNGKEVHTFTYHNEATKESLRYLLQNLFRKTDFRPGQEAIINRAIQGKDVIGLLPTGGGKSLTFQLCALLQPGVTVVVDPINSLMKDQFDKLIENGFSRASFINSSNSKEERNKRMADLAGGQYQILFVSPERFQMENFRQSLSACRNTGVYFSYAVIDEAHCVSEWGHDFRHVYLNLAQNLKRFCHSKLGTLTLFGLTATASFDVLADVQRELDLKEDAIASLPAEAIDRKELNYSIVQISAEIQNGLPHYVRERQMGEGKYPVIKQMLLDMPTKIAALEKKYGYLSVSGNFYGKYEGEYKNAGVIFCPTKSVKLPNGVMHLAYGRDKNGGGLSELPFLELRTFFGAEGDDTIGNALVAAAADDSYENQEAFIKNKANLMLATKAFGMGIDKPNIRYSIHYTFPSSVESFYQEAGRAGRDGNPSLCSILYHPVDEEANLDFFMNGFKGIEREIDIVDELLNEVQYEDNFYVNVLGQKIKDQYPEVKSVALYNDRYIYLNGPWHVAPEQRVRIGLLDLERDLRSYDNATQNFSVDKAEEILSYSKGLLREMCPDEDYLAWFQTKSSPGIRTQIESSPTGRHVLKIGFTNGVVSELNKRIQAAGFDDFEERIIRAAYDFSGGPDGFLEGLRFHYYNFQMSRYGFEQRQFMVDAGLKNHLRESYHQIRNSQDTQRAIYRLNILGIIDDYVIDYTAKMIEVRFQAKSDEAYFQNFKAYLRRYLGIERTQEWLEKARKQEGNSVLTKVLYALIEFANSEIAEKRKRGISYMKTLCEVFTQEGEADFRDRMVRYFTSKYARTDYLPRDTDQGTKASCAIVRKYISYIDTPPDGLGGPIDNAKHLLGACDNLRINMTKNASIDLLTAFSKLALELKQEDTRESATLKPKVLEAMDLYRSGFKDLLQAEGWDEVKDLLSFFNHKILDFNREIKPVLDILESEIRVSRTHFKLKKFIDKISA